MNRFKTNALIAQDNPGGVDSGRGGHRKTARKKRVLFPEVSIREDRIASNPPNEGAIFFVVSRTMDQNLGTERFPFSCSVLFDCPENSYASTAFVPSERRRDVYSLSRLAAWRCAWAEFGVSDALADEATGQLKFKSELVPRMAAERFVFEIARDANGEGEVVVWRPMIRSEKGTEPAVKHWMSSESASFSGYDAAGHG